MEEVKVFYDRIGKSLIIWFDDPQKEAICEEFDEDTVLMKNKEGKVIGIERMNLHPANKNRLRWAFEEVVG